MSNCTTPNCSRPRVARGLCSACYMREWRAAAAGYAGRAPNGSRYPEALKSSAEWSDRFRQKICKTDGCHEWVGTKTQQGYGVFFVAGRTLLAHRLAFVMGGGDHAVPVVMHTCDNPSCVNPEHLKAGSYVANMADMDAKGRRNVGKAGEHLKDRARHPKAKAVHTPFGEFSSAALAAEHIGLHVRSVARYCKDGVKGYYYL